jgi:hypothetical protein
MTPRPLLHRLALLALASALALATSSARATVMIEVPLERLVAESDLVVHGRVTRTGARLVANDGGHHEPHTVAVVALLEVLRGTPPAAEVLVDEIGGRVQDTEMRIAGTPEYRVGEEVVLFLRALPDGSYRTYAMAQGAFEVLPALPGAERVVVRDTRAVSMARWSQGQMRLDHGEVAAMPLATFLAYVREVADMLELAEIGGAR